MKFLFSTLFILAAALLSVSANAMSLADAIETINRDFQIESYVAYDYHPNAGANETFAFRQEIAQTGNCRVTYRHTSIVGDRFDSSVKREYTYEYQIALNDIKLDHSIQLNNHAWYTDENGKSKKYYPPYSSLMFFIKWENSDSQRIDKTKTWREPVRRFNWKFKFPRDKKELATEVAFAIWNAAKACQN